MRKSSSSAGPDGDAARSLAQVDRATELLVRRCGRKPFGYFKGEPETIMKMRSLREKGLGFDRIAAELNDQGIATRSRKSWHGLVVNRILHRPARDAGSNGASCNPAAS